MIHYIARFICWVIIKVYFRCTVLGRGNAPLKGAFIFASNHASFLDPFLLGTSISRPLYYMARETLFARPAGGWILRKIHAFPVNREGGDLSAMRQALRLLGEGKPLVMFPEGTRTQDGSLQGGKAGIGLIVAKAGVPVLPAYIEGSFKAWPRGARAMKPYRIKVYIGKPLYFNSSSYKGKDGYQRISEEIMGSITELADENLGSAREGVICSASAVR
ncbi:MAG: 1-acyl-sn-glycerol-3-phosphate acyltransferase [Candidatus Omnitrophica bacterium]|nr:1-acyl-sn-glycerol-3-phosphate acyltransferase [Candidatus Omnitrophota bacterium]